MKNKYYQIVQNGTVADVYIYGDLYEWPYREMGEVNALGLLQEIKDSGADVVNVHIDSFGGSVKEGWGLYNGLRELDATVNTYADGFVASAALYPFLAGRERVASSVSAFYLHQMLASVYGYADDLRKEAEELDKLTEIGVQAFVDVTGRSKEEILELMKAETWLDAAQALELGIATRIETGQDAGMFQQSARQKAVQRLLEQKTPAPPERNRVLEMLQNA